MMKFTHVSMDVDAIQFIYNEDCINEIKKEFHGFIGLTYKSKNPKHPGEMQILSHVGKANYVRQIAMEGDWVLRDPFGDVRSMSDSKFRKIFVEKKD